MATLAQSNLKQYWVETYDFTDENTAKFINLLTYNRIISQFLHDKTPPKGHTWPFLVLFYAFTLEALKNAPNLIFNLELVLKNYLETEYKNSVYLDNFNDIFFRPEYRRERRLLLTNYYRLTGKPYHITGAIDYILNPVALLNPEWAKILKKRPIPDYENDDIFPQPLRTPFLSPSDLALYESGHQSSDFS